MENSEKQALFTYLDEVLSFEASKLVGKTFKRIEILSDPETLKKELRELIYENFRDLRDIFYAYSKGLEKSYFIVRKSEDK